MAKISIPDIMRCPLCVQFRKNRLFNPLKVDCFATQTHPLWNSTKQHTFYHIHLALDSKFKIPPKINNYECVSLNRFDILSCVRSSVIIQLRFKNRKLQNAMHACVLFASSAVWYTHIGTLSYSSLYRTDMPTHDSEDNHSRQWTISHHPCHPVFCYTIH